MNKLLDDATAAGFCTIGDGIYTCEKYEAREITKELAKFADLQQPQWIDSTIESPFIQEGKDYSKNVFGLYKDYKGNLNLSIFQYLIIDELEDCYEYAWAKLGRNWHDLRDDECEFDDDYEVMYWMPIDLPSPPINTEVT